MEDISSRRNRVIVHFRKLQSDRGYRRQQGEYVCQGRKLLEEGLRFGARINTVLWPGQPKEEPRGPMKQYCLGRELLSYVSSLKESDGPIFSVSIPDWDIKGEISRVMVLEGIQDPGNVGTIIRTASALSADGVILTGACADPYNPKTARAAMGALFRQPVWEMDLAKLEDFLLERQLTLYGAVLSGDAVGIRGLKLTRAAVAVGSEGGGLSPEILSRCGGKLTIPMDGRSESLNAAVAAAIIMWEIF